MECPPSPASSVTLSIHSIEDGESSTEGISLKEECADHKHNVPSNKGDADLGEFSCTECFNFTLPVEYLLIKGTCGQSPSIFAACDPDSRVLHKILYHGFDLFIKNSSSYSAHFRESLTSSLGLDDSLVNVSRDFSHKSIRTGNELSTPLLAAVRSRLPRNVGLLLAAGADPNGVPTKFLSNYAAYFMRFRSSIPHSVLASLEDHLFWMDHDQFAPLTSAELEDRRCGVSAPFWCERDFTQADLYPPGWQSHSLVAAAYSGITEIFDQLVVFGAESSHWVGELDLECGCRSGSPSSLSISTPLHAAIHSANMNMLHHLLDLRFNPNVLTSVNPTQCHTPLMATLISRHKFYKEAFDILVSHSEINIYLRTPVYKIHVLHFAVARLELATLIHVATHIPLYTAGLTALGHNLLHIACMPASPKHIQSYSEIIYRSIHETRELSSTNAYSTRNSPDIILQVSDYIEDFEAQNAVVSWLLSSGIGANLGLQDAHGNTPIHYLASYFVVNTKLLDWLKTLPGVMQIWKDCENSKGATPEMLLLEGSKFSRPITMTENVNEEWMSNEDRDRVESIYKFWQ